MSGIEHCVIEGCTRLRDRRMRMCSTHRQRRRRYGDALAHIPIGSVRFLADAAAEMTRAEVERVAYAPTPPAPGRGLLWLV